jgi:outer membrane biosynthesis protein TonB
MARSLITFPIRLGLRGANMAVDGIAAVAGQALGIAGRLAEVLTKDGGPDLDIDGREHEPEQARERRRSAGDKPRRQRRPSPAPARPAEATKPEPAPAPETTPPSDVQAPETTAPSDVQAPETTAHSEVQAPETEPQPTPTTQEEAPAHVSEEPTLVDEVAETGAEDGAGAQVRVDEPWENYHQLGAKDVIDRLIDASTAQLAAVQLYEQSHRRRQTVLEAVEHQLRRAGT